MITSPSTTQEKTEPVPHLRRSRSGRGWLALLALLIACGAGAAALRTLRPAEFQRGVTLAASLLQEGWAKASPLIDRVPPLLHRARLALPF